LRLAAHESVLQVKKRKKEGVRAKGAVRAEKKEIPYKKALGDGQYRRELVHIGWKSDGRVHKATREQKDGHRRHAERSWTIFAHGAWGLSILG